MLVSLFFLLTLASHGFSHYEHESARYDQIWRNQDVEVDDSDYTDNQEKSAYGEEMSDEFGSSDSEYSNPLEYDSNSKVQEDEQNRKVKGTEHPSHKGNEDFETMEDNYGEYDDESIEDDGKEKGEASIDDYEEDHYGYGEESDDENLIENYSKPSKPTTNDIESPKGKGVLKRKLGRGFAKLINIIKQVIQKIKDRFTPHVTPKPKPHVTPKPKPSVTTRPKPRVTEKPKPRVTVKPKPSVTVKPKPRVTVKPKPPVTVKPKPRVTVKPKPPVTVKPKPRVTVKPKSRVTVKPKPEVTEKPNTRSTVKPKPHFTKKPSHKGKDDYDPNDDYYNGYDTNTDDENEQESTEDYIEDKDDYPDENDQEKDNGTDSAVHTFEPNHSEKPNGTDSEIPQPKPHGTEKPKGREPGKPKGKGKPKPFGGEKINGKVIMRRRAGGMGRGREGILVGNSDSQGNDFYNGYQDNEYPLNYPNGRGVGRNKHKGMKNKFGGFYYEDSNENNYYTDEDDYHDDYPVNKKVKPFAPGRKHKNKIQETTTKKPSNTLPHLAIFGKLTGFVEKIFGREEK